MAAAAAAPMQSKKTSQITPSGKLGDQAATAALYVTNAQKMNGNSGTQTQTQSQSLLDQNGKLSSASAATSLKYADQKDLPSYPSTGIKNQTSAAGAAASLGWANQKSVEHWKPSPSSNASAAALLAADTKSPKVWQPQQSSNGAKAAVLAHRDTKKVDTWKPETTSHGSSAATLAFKNNTNRRNSPSSHDNTRKADVTRHGSMMAAKGAVSGRTTQRKRADSTPLPPPSYPDQANASQNALRAATASHSKIQTNAAEAGSSPIVHMNRNMYTYNPPVGPEVEEKNRADILHASAVAMAKRMYDVQQKQFDQAASHAAVASSTAAQEKSTTSFEDMQPRQYVNLQEAAQKLANERLAKLHDDHDKSKDYREYYSGESTAPKRRISVLGIGRRRSSSDSSFDREQSMKIRSQMSLFSNNLAQVDEQKRKKDRESLMAAAKRNVTASLQGMDEKVFADTGKVAPSLLSHWELKAHAAAQQKSETRLENHGKIDIGGGKFMTQSAIDQVAARNVQPVLDEINQKVEQERARQAEIQAEKELKQKVQEEKKAREKEEKEAARKQKEEEKQEEKAKKEEAKAAKQEEKEEAKAAKQEHKEEAKAAKQEHKEEVKAAKQEHKEEVKAAKQEQKEHSKEEKEHAKEEKQQAKEEKKTAKAEKSRSPTFGKFPLHLKRKDSATNEENASATTEPTPINTESTEVVRQTTKGESSPDGLDSPKSDSKVRSWLRNKFGHRLSLSRSKNEDEKKGSFEGPLSISRNGSQNSFDSRQQPSSIAEVALAGRDEVGGSSSVGLSEPLPLTAEPAVTAATTSSPTAATSLPVDQISEVSALTEDEFQEARTSIEPTPGEELNRENLYDADDLVPPPKIGSPVGSDRSRGSARNSRFLEEISP